MEFSKQTIRPTMWSYYVMEFLDGGNLRDKIIENGGAFFVEEAYEDLLST